VSTFPSAQGGEAFAYDPQLGETILYGGWEGTSTTDVP
jgi:hypothetical protein